MRLTLRETTWIRSGLRSGRLARLGALWLGVTALATLAGPFGTLALPPATRAAYWAVCVGASIPLSLFIVPRAYEARPLLGLPRWVRGMAGSLVFSVVYAALVAWIGGAAIGGGYPGFFEMLLYVAPVACGVTAFLHLFDQIPGDAPPSAAPSDAAGARFLKRLKPELGRDLVRLSMQDHYVEAVTTKGSELILMRFADALDELEGVEGWRVHRSHWIAASGVAKALREDGKIRLVATDGATLPVSRTYAPALREAGVLKRRG